MLTTLERQHIERHFPDIDPNSVRGRLGMGIEKVALVLSSAADGVRGKVLKLLRKDTQRDPLSSFVSPAFTSTADESQRDADMCERYFGNAVVVPTIIRSTVGDAYCILQDKLDMEMLTPAILMKHPTLLDQLRQLLDQDVKLQKDQSLFFDFQGWDLWRVLLDQIAMANVAVIWEGERPVLKIFDLTLMRTPALSPRAIPHIPAYVSNQRNNARMLHSVAVA